MNNKGFSLIELLATIVILGILSAITITTISNAYQKSQDKAYEAFTKSIKNYVSDYISLKGSKETYTNKGKMRKYYKDANNKDAFDVVDFYGSENLSIETIISEVSGDPLKNPSTKVECKNSNTNLYIYRDSDFVYCFKLEKEGNNSCINDPIDTCSAIFSPNS